MVNQAKMKRVMPKKVVEKKAPIGKMGKEPLILPNYSGVKKFSEDQAVFVKKSGDTMTGKLILPQENTPTAPTIAFGDGDTGIYEYADDGLRFSFLGTSRWSMHPTAFYSSAALGAKLTATSSATAPFVTIMGDADTGLGRAAEDQLSLIAGGVEAMRLWETAGAIDAQINGDTYIKGGNLRLDNSKALKIRNAGDTSTGTVLQVYSDDKMYLDSVFGDMVVRVKNGFDLDIGDVARNPYIFAEGSTGDVGIGTKTPSSKLHVAGDVTIDDTKSLNFGPDTALSVDAANFGAGTLILTSTSGELVSPTDLSYYANTAADGSGTWEPSMIFGTDGSLTLANTTQGTAANKKLTISFTSGVEVTLGNLDVVAGAISSATATITASSDNTNVAGINTLFINPGAAVVIGGFAGGVDGQVLHVIVVDADQDVTMENEEASGTQKLAMHQSTDETLNSERGGWTFVFNSTTGFWHDCSHARHV